MHVCNSARATCAISGFFSGHARYITGAKSHEFLLCQRAMACVIKAVQSLARCASCKATRCYS